MPSATPVADAQRISPAMYARPPRLNALLINQALLTPMQQHLQAAGRDGFEEAALLAGYVANLAGRAFGVVTTVLLPYTDHTQGGCAIPLDVTARCLRLAKQVGQLVLAQVHTHPGRCCTHSATDNHWAVVDAPGFFSLVVPCFARFGLDRMFADGAGVYERMADGRWRPLGQKEIAQRFILIPTSVGIV